MGGVNSGVPGVSGGVPGVWVKGSCRVVEHILHMSQGSCGVAAESYYVTMSHTKRKRNNSDNVVAVHSE